MKRAAPAILLFLSASILVGCANKRRILVTSEPSGARVWVNDTEIGVTPAETSFKFYGDYDIRLELEGYEPVRETRAARAPLHEMPVIDFFALLAPVRFSDEVVWDFTLEQSREISESAEEMTEGILDRARELRGRAPLGAGADPEE